MATNAQSGKLGFFDRLRTGWTLTKDSASVIRTHPKLLVFPLLAGLSAVFFLGLIFLPLVLTDVLGLALEYVVLIVLFFVTTFFSTYFSAALVYAANEAFHDREPGIRDSLSAVNDRLGAIVIWSLISATVSIIFRGLEDTPLSGLVGSLFAFGWSIMTFFIVPVLVFEEVTSKSMFTKSGSVFKETWGETLGAGFGITGIIVGTGLVLVAGAIAISAPVSAVFPGAEITVTVVLVALAVVFTYLLSQTIWGVVKTALYIYANEGVTPEQFDNFDFETLNGRTEQTSGTVSGRESGTSIDD